MSAETILILGANGQIGLELAETCRGIYGENHVVTSDIKPLLKPDGIYEQLDVLDKDRMYEIIRKHKVTQVYLLAALLSATAEQKPKSAWNLNMEGLFHVRKENVIIIDTDLPLID